MLPSPVPVFVVQATRRLQAAPRRLQAAPRLLAAMAAPTAPTQSHRLPRWSLQWWALRFFEPTNGKSALDETPVVARARAFLAYVAFLRLVGVVVDVQIDVMKKRTQNHTFVNWLTNRG